MERRGGLCIARYGGEADVAWKVGRIMLRFRPIAPKPAAGSEGPAPAPGASADVRAPRAKRKASGREGRRRGRKRTKVASTKEERKEEALEGPLSSVSSKPSSSSSSYNSGSAIVTLPLMPETPERKEEPTPPSASSRPSDLAIPCVPPVWQSAAAAAAAAGEEAGCMGSVVVVAPRPVRPAGSWVALECVTETWREGELGGASDEEVRENMEGEEACPGFVSDVWDRVTWVNDAYKRMVVGPTEADGAEGEAEELRVALATKGMVPAGAGCRAFTCRVRVRYASRRGRGSLAAPCDVWRLEGGGLAWRLDIRAALSLSMGA